MSNPESFDPDTVQLVAGCLIEGQRVPGDGTPYDVRRPSDDHLVAEERSASATMVDAAVDVAQRAFRHSGWRGMAPRQRAAAMLRWADLIVQHAQELARLESVVSTRGIGVTQTRDVLRAADIIRYYAELVDKVEGQVLASSDAALSMTLREPHGVVAAISPWNVPLVLATIKLAPALAAGNAIVLKPGENTCYAILRAAELALEAGIPAGQIAVLPGLGAETGDALVKHPGVDYVTFTGSTATGARVAASAALHGVKPVSLELGGKSPHLVLADAGRLDALAQLIGTGIAQNAGQICYAGTRLIVAEKIADTLIEHLQTYFSGLRPGPTWNVASTLSPIFSRSQANRIDDILGRATLAGAQVLCGGQRYEGERGGERGIYFMPTLLSGCAPSNAAVQEEIFGPVLTVERFSGDLEEGIALVNCTHLGLAAAVHTSNLTQAMRAARSIQAGTVWVNSYGPTPELNAPLGGYKQSGYGKDLGTDGLLKYFKTKHVWIDTAH